MVLGGTGSVLSLIKIQIYWSFKQLLSWVCSAFGDVSPPLVPYFIRLNLTLKPVFHIALNVPRLMKVTLVLGALPSAMHCSSSQEHCWQPA